jgi:Fe-S-cluster-containing dehydrogenase component/anaerobic selenocysteine-containing dehydrogenase
MSEKEYWSTLEEREGTEAYLRHRDEEFIHKPVEDMEEGGSLKPSRRGVIKAGGAAAIFAGAMGCNPERRLVPYHNQPEEVIPGNPVYYASVDAEGENGLVVKTTEGRPIRLDGNAAHAVTRGKLDAVGNAQIIDLYDPDRLRSSVKITGEEVVATKAEAIVAELAPKLKAAGSKAVLVTRPVHGAGNKAVLAAVKKAFPGLKHVEVSTEEVSGIMDAQSASYGQRVLPTFRYDRAELVVSLGYDFLAEAPNRVETSRLFGDCRRYRDEGGMGRVVSFEPFLSMTAAAGDERHRVIPQALPHIALAIAAELKKLEVAVPAGVVLTHEASKVEKEWGLKEGVIHDVAHELKQLKGKSLVVAGGTLAHMEGGELLLNATNLLNTMLKNDGSTVSYGDEAILSHSESPAALSGLIAEANSGKIDALVIADVNLSYLAPAVSGFDKAMSKIATKVGLFTHLNETALLCDSVISVSHFLEDWGDAESRKGLHVLGQPVIEPLWETSSRQQILLDLAGSGKKWMNVLKQAWKTDVYASATFAADFDTFWSAALREGVVDLNAKGRDLVMEQRKFKATALKAKAPKIVPEGYQLVLHRTALHGSGESMNNAWLLEIPDPVSKVCWENYVAVSVGTAKKEGFKEGQIVTLKTGDGVTLDVPVHIQPGLHDKVMAVALGWGRTLQHLQVAIGPSGTGVGVDAGLLASGDAVAYNLAGIPVSWSATEDSTTLANVQGHHYLTNPRIRATGEESRKILQDAFLEEFEDEGNDSWTIPYHMPTDISLWKQKFPEGSHKWGMAIDTNTCTGCAACMVSCQAENNISVVGKDEVIINREMHWIRIDRYYTSSVGHDDPEVTDPDEVDVVNQPMLCQHCDNAPCETVCPVVATTHNEEGLNVQTYNRCVGTRYCSNNCPYKVRHYNWYDYSDYRAGVHQSGRPLTRFLRQVGIGQFLGLGKAPEDKTEFPLMLQFNPDVTVRSRGVMEKCSFCVHKIRRWHTDEQHLGRELPESAKQTACQQACPTDAISFGNLLDEKSEITKVNDKKGAYKVLKELNTEANVTYLTRLRNRPMLAKADDHSDKAH